MSAGATQMDHDDPRLIDGWKQKPERFDVVGPHDQLTLRRVGILASAWAALVGSVVYPQLLLGLLIVMPVAMANSGAQES